MDCVLCVGEPAAGTASPAHRHAGRRVHSAATAPHGARVPGRGKPLLHSPQSSQVECQPPTKSVLLDISFLKF